eukprot:SAG22_NODE_3633_length_1603_cov_2.744681_2_plen_133_part_00
MPAYRFNLHVCLLLLPAWASDTVDRQCPPGSGGGGGGGGGGLSRLIRGSADVSRLRQLWQLAWLLAGLALLYWSVPMLLELTMRDNVPPLEPGTNKLFSGETSKSASGTNCNLPGHQLARAVCLSVSLCPGL